MEKEKVVVLVTFGSSNILGIEESIKILEKEIKEYFNFAVGVLIAFTSKVIVKILKEKGYSIRSLEENLKYLVSNDVKEVIIQPLFIMDGSENRKIKESVREYSNKFKSLSINTNLLQGEEEEVNKYIKIIVEIIKSYENQQENILIVGHGSKDSDNNIYIKLREAVNKISSNKVYLATLEGEQNLLKVIAEMKEDTVKKVNMVPLFLMKGKHIINDLYNGENSWKNILESEGFKVRYQLKSLLEYEEIRRIYIEKINFSDNLQNY